MSTALILFAHGARDPEWAAPMRHVQQLLRSALPQARIDLAFLEFMSPNLAEAVTAGIAEGATKIAIVPMFIAQGGHLKRELPELVAALRTQYPAVEFVLSGPIGEQPAVMAAMAESVRTLAGL